MPAVCGRYGKCSQAEWRHVPSVLVPGSGHANLDQRKCSHQRDIGTYQKYKQIICEAMFTCSAAAEQRHSLL